MTKYFAGETSTEEEAVLLRWRRASIANESEFSNSQKLFDATTRHYSRAGVPEIDVEKEWNTFLTKVDKHKPVIPLHPRSSGLWMKIAASLLLLIASSAIIYYY